MDSANDRADGSRRPGEGIFVGEASRGYSRPPTSQEAVLREIRRAIMARELRPGERVRQEKLARRLNVSRVPVREALKVLEAEGQVTYQPHRGYTVVALSSEELEEIYLIRRLLETEATRRAVPRVDAELIERLEALMGQMEELAEAGDVLRYAEANRDFHLVLFERAGLPRLYHMIEVLWRISEAYRGAIFDYSWSKRAHKYHRAIIVACKAGDVAGTIAAQDEHRSDAITSITAFLKRPDYDRKRYRGEE